MQVNTSKLLFSAVLATALFATNQYTQAAEPGAMPNMPGMRMPAQASDLQTGRGVGVVQSVNAGTNTVTLVSEAVPERGWPADMSMEYKVEGTAAANISAGQKVNFEFTGPGMDVTITRIDVVE